MQRSQDLKRDSVMRRAPDSSTADNSGAAPHPLLALQRQVGNAQVVRMLAQRASVPEEEEDAMLQAMPEIGLEGGPVSADLSSRIQAQRGGGSALDAGTQATMEAGFGTSFEGVRVHTGSESAHLNRSISAKAFTTGNDIFLGHGASASDHNLIAHELTHVVQQRSMASGGSGMTVGPAGDNYEQQADAMASAVTSGAVGRKQAEADSE